MIDREKVIKALELCSMKYECCTVSPTVRCPYEKFLGTCEDLCDECTTMLAKDVLALLKEQEAKEGHWIVLEFCANEGIYCSECHMKIFDRTTKPKDKLSKYCPHCGSRNEQFFRDGEVVFR